MVYGWMASSGSLVLVVKCVSKFSLLGGGFILSLFYFIFHYIMVGFGIHREYEDSSSDLIDMMLKFQLEKILNKNTLN